MPLHYKEDLQKKIDVFLEKELITPCHSPYSAPAMLVPKKNGKLPLVLDYRQLNKQTIKSIRPIPSIEETFDTLEDSAYFTSIDMSAGFYQVPMEESSQDYTAFNTPFGFFKWLVSSDGLEVDPSKIEAVQKFPVPRSQIEAKLFLGLASYYRRFVPKIVEIARRLHRASEASTKFEWTHEAQVALEPLKLKLTSTPILAFPCLKEPFILYTDASQFAMGSVLAQMQDGKDRAICYASRSLSKSQTKYSATRRELPALVTFTRNFRHHLLGQKFTSD